ncbi:MAG: hypothetical protein ACRDRL_20855 [Sciscionella sp.]
MSTLEPRVVRPGEGWNELIPAELADVREELRRIDGKARDLLVAATLAVTAAAAVAVAMRGQIPLAPRIGFGLAVVPWLAGLALLLRVIRPMLLVDPPDVPGAGLDIRRWQLRRLQVLARIVHAKYRRVQHAVDAMLSVLALAAASGALWLLLALFA